MAEVNEKVLNGEGLAALWELIKAEDAVIEALANAKANIAIGSYTGTGKGGSSNPCKITVDFEPKFLFVIEAVSELNVIMAVKGSNKSGFLIRSGTHHAFASSNATLLATFSGNAVSWYSSSDSDSTYKALNVSGKVYYYMVIG